MIDCIKVNELTEASIAKRKQMMNDMTAFLRFYTEDERGYLTDLLERMSQNNDLGESHIPKAMGEPEFWLYIQEAGWGVIDHNYDRVKKYFIERMDYKSAMGFHKRYDEKYRLLSRKVDRYCEEMNEERKGHGLPFSGDDSFGDMIAHAIGFGEYYFHRCLEDPRTLRSLNVEESFAYALPYESDYEEGLEKIKKRFDFNY